MTQQQNPESWLDEHGDYLFRFALMRLKKRELAEDMVQETFLAAWKSHKSFAGDSSLRTWLTGILKHKIADYIRKEIRTRNLNEQAEHDPTSIWFNHNGSWKDAPAAWQSSPESLLANEQFHHTLQQCLEKLPGKQQKIFELRELAGISGDEICNDLEISQTNLHVIMYRARMSLRQCLQNHWFGKKTSAGRTSA
ncbi:MAG: RNA polymerase subunit sigma-70 [Zetaproteobacteria bacterium CG_4_9_14_3_um_filter_49_83]|nr:MAG: RNA polymerase subunit sigma-70 [Zetaproteobacteria bacterium CG1_02_49_23]PIQ32299.1 MAG: RNA polymerase subunit sigma-70 [Zetaproteobacteria bacterium CG17_big_fil_post_rev_8_21_14_2_50_50_13]PIV30062.1 MAG: RNA polymerase subunit sigma-70 [Zetaproteobacteria bacterium CG02_land_8_20_14_3_00_50_9]PIY56985.1 MAG: RNA polymerase subunit sigma-70 [Zetaproteobacteria bacterium CG_4_10_14_0_8_um_filter_49_80]PJA34652.1 MAG: RNA polymerase subunit sigma-70 [Zetaproteobacteria bacterium CG_4